LLGGGTSLDPYNVDIFWLHFSNLSDRPASMGGGGGGSTTK